MTTERRFDPFTGRSVLISPGRRGIGGTKPGGLPEPSLRCPFCPGHEADSERTVARWPKQGAWSVRVVGNKYPVVAQGFDRAEGVHEVVVEAREHDADLADYEPAHMARVVWAWRARVRALEADPTAAAVLLFRNRGRRAGSSQPHPHSQIVATSWVPAEVALRWRVALRHLAEEGETVHAAELRRELGSERVLQAGALMASFCPYAPSRAFEVRIAPLETRGGFAMATDEELAALASHLSEAAQRVRRNTSVEDYNLVLRQPPARETGPAAAWHLELLPRTGGDAGFELAGGEMIVVVTPEAAAARLRA